MVAMFSGGESFSSTMLMAGVMPGEAVPVNLWIGMGIAIALAIWSYIKWLRS